MLTAHLHLAPKLRMSGSVPPISLYAFMSWAVRTLLYRVNGNYCLHNKLDALINIYFCQTKKKTIALSSFIHFFCLLTWASAASHGCTAACWLIYRPLWTFQLWPSDVPAPTDAFRTLAAEVGTYGRRIGLGILPKCRLPRYM
jgi:hypothetical protein